MDRAFIEAYARQGISAEKMMPLSGALELSRTKDHATVKASAAAAAEQVPEDSSFRPDEAVAASPASQTSLPAARFDEIDNMPQHEQCGLQALLQVDAFVWPKKYKKLSRAARGAFETLSACVTAEVERGRNLVGFAGDGEASGCTTLLLCLAKQLAARMSVVVVDLNGNNPGVDCSLGFLPDVGWKDVAAGRVPLAEAMIDSLDDEMTVVPYAAHQAAEYGPAAASGGVEPLRQLALHYDLVLLDLGELPVGTGNEALLGCLDAAVIVRTAEAIRCHAPSRTAEILKENGVGILGVVENRCTGSKKGTKTIGKAA